MTQPTKPALRAIEGVARHCSSTWEPREGAASAVLTLDGRRVALAVAALPEPFPDRTGSRPARLREDRVAHRFLADLEAAIAPRTPPGRVVIMTFGAPIRLASRTVAALTAILHDRLARDVGETEDTMDVLGNRVRFLIARNDGAWTAGVVGFVFTGDPAPRDLAIAMVALRGAIVATASACTPTVFPGAWWLCLAGVPEIADVATTRRALARLALPDRFETIVTLGRTGRIETLAGRSPRTLYNVPGDGLS